MRMNIIEESVMRRVRVMAGMAEFVGKTGEAVKEGRMWRVYLDEPVMVPSVGAVRHDLWEGRFLKTVRSSRATKVGPCA